MSRYEKLIENKYVNTGMLLLSLPSFSQGVTLVSQANGDISAVVIGVILMFIGSMLMWLPFNHYRDKANMLKEDLSDMKWQRDEYRSLARRSGFRGGLSARATTNTWIDDDDIDGDGRGGDTLRRMGVIQ